MGVWLAEKGYQETFRDNGNGLHLDKGLRGVTVFSKTHKLCAGSIHFIVRKSDHLKRTTHRDGTLVNA